MTKNRIRRRKTRERVVRTDRGEWRKRSYLSSSIHQPEEEQPGTSAGQVFFNSEIRTHVTGGIKTNATGLLAENLEDWLSSGW